MLKQLKKKKINHKFYNYGIIVLPVEKNYH